MTMDDKTKALDIAMSLIDCELPTLEKCRKSAIQMAEWKEQQMIDKMCDWLEKHITNYINWEYNEFHQCVEYDGSYDIEKMISDVRKAMEE